MLGITKFICGKYFFFILLFISTACTLWKSNISKDELANQHKLLYEQESIVRKTTVFNYTTLQKKNKQFDSKASIPITPFCWKSKISEANESFLTTPYTAFSLAFFPTDRPLWKYPIIIEGLEQNIFVNSINQSPLNIDLSSIPDGKYNIMVCKNTESCKQLPYSQLASFIKSRLASSPIFTIAKNSAKIDPEAKTSFSEAYSDIFSWLATQSKSTDIFGLGVNIWIEQGHLVWPTSKTTIWNNHLVTSNFLKIDPNFIDKNATIPFIAIKHQSSQKNTKNGSCFPQLNIFALDFNKNGIRFSAPYEGKKIDVNQDGILEFVGWPKNDPVGFLMIDSNQDGKFNDINEIFSNMLKDFKFKDVISLIKSMDTNKDSILDSRDKYFQQLGLWVDNNANGIVDDAEALPLKKAKIKSINLDFKKRVETDHYGNTSDYQSIVNMDNETNMIKISSIYLISTDH
ncbi:MAG: hypothetical protein R3B45_02275 [Bdellovibrionota bacterium]